MAPLNERQSLLTAWRALAGTSPDGDGWRAIPLGKDPSIRAGRHFPGNEEALLVGFNEVIVPTNEHLPHGKGFLVACVDLNDVSYHYWIALSRRADGSLDLFTAMVLDMIEAVHAASTRTSQQAFQMFLTRIRAWQDFMQRGSDTVIDPRVEVGLIGELTTILEIIAVGVHPAIPIEGWDGPNGGVHDFILGNGSIETKTTIASTGFPVVIESLDQLDDAIRQPLFLVGVRLRLAPDGCTLPELVDRVRAGIADDPARAHFDMRLLQIGYLDAARERYERRYAVVETMVLPIDHSFPRLTQATVPAGIFKARYDIDIDQIPAMRDALQHLGVL
jgi:hypothetical protein